MSVGVHPRPRDAKWVRFEDLPKREGLVDNTASESPNSLIWTMTVDNV